ncbi:amidohydrolase family protein [Galbitalea soli]|uniref:Amidohydrolase family protein n=1 Tax=Galbitalea soli TaxID=1268042 RepID=A0A7C9TR09_9MICO|nr:amidohydrolase family protein [Galbitalea soli]NYJ29730.1 L-fuconolactonase [Galbitalea soli]
MIIDAHQHVWNLDRADYPWLDAGLSPIDRTMELDEVLPAMRRVGVTGTVLVQAADNAEDTANMIRVADEHPEVLGIVAWVPLDRPHEAERRLAELRRDERVVGVRTLLHAQPDPDWVTRPEVDAGLTVLEAAGAAFDYVTGGPAALGHLPGISERHPGLRIVIDHLGKPPIGGTAEDRAEWRRLIATAAENPRMAAKVSGLYASVGPLDSWTVASVRPFVQDALELFGPERLMVGGDWPISVLAGGYDRTWEALALLTGDLAPAAREQLLGATAAAVYGLRRAG